MRAPSSDSFRILLVAESLTTGVGGIAIHASELGCALARRGHVVTFLSPEQFTGHRVLTRWRSRLVSCPTAPAMKAWELPIVWTPRRAFTKLQVEWRWKPWLHRLIDRTDAQIVHWHGVDVDSALTRPLPAGRVGVFTNHSSQFLAMASVDARSAVTRFDHARQIIAPSRQLADLTIAGGISAERVHVIPNGVDTQRYRPDPAARLRFRATHRIPDDAVLTIAARRFVEKNGIIYLAKAAADLDRSLGHPVVLCFAGNGPGGDQAYTQEVRAICERLGHRVDVRWLGWVSSLDMPATLAGADIAVLPSLVEATSLAGLEAMATGCVLLATRVGGIPELVDDGVTGRLVDPADHLALATAWRELIDDAEMRHRLAIAARTRAERLFSWDRIAEQTEGIYRLALGDAPARQTGQTRVHAPA